MAKTFDCPTCGAPLDYEGGSTTIRCPYCHNSVIVPEELQAGNEGLRDSGASFGQAGSFVGSDVLEQFKEVKALAAAGKKIEAIKLFRQITNVGLKEAKDAVEALEAGSPIEVSHVSTAGLTVLSSSSGASPDTSIAFGKVVALAQEGKKIEAIKLFRETFDVGLVEAKTAVEKIQVGNFDEVAQMSLGSSYIPQVLPPAAGPKSSPATTAGGAGCLVLIIGFILLLTLGPILIAMASDGGPLSGAWARVNPFAFARLTLSFGGEGNGPGRFTDVRNIAVDNHTGTVYVTELENGRVQVFDSSGKYLTQWNAGAGKTYISALAADRQGSLYLVISGELGRYDGATGTLLGKLQYQEDRNSFDYVAAAVDGGLITSWNEFSDDLVRFDKDGSVTWVVQKAISSITEDSELESHVAIDGMGNVYVAGTFNDAVFKYSPTGKYLNRWGGEGDGKGQFSFPDAIAVDNRGRVYVNDNRGIQVFDPDGRYLARISVPHAVFGMAITDNNELWVVTNDQKVSKYIIVK